MTNTLSDYIRQIILYVPILLANLIADYLLDGDIFYLIIRYYLYLQLHSNNSSRYYNNLLPHMFNNQASTSFALPKNGKHWHIPVLMVFCLMPLTAINMAAFHTLIELFAVCIAIMSFVVSWNTFSITRNHFLLFLGCGYFWVGILDLLHALTFKNILMFDGIKPGTTIELWIAARFLEAFTLLFVSHFAMTKIRALTMFTVMGLSSISLLALIFLNWFPDMFTPGKGLSSIKIASEYVIISILAIAALSLLKQHKSIERSTLRLLLVSIALTIIAELTFTLYQGLDDTPIIIGHFLKLFSFWAIYCALVESALTRPFHSLYQVVHAYDSMEDITVIIDQQGVIQHVNNAVIERHGNHVVGTHCHEALHPDSISIQDCKICQAIQHNESLYGLEIADNKDNLWHEANVSPIYASPTLSVMVHSMRDITSRKRAEQQFNSLNRLYNVLSQTNKAIVQTEDREDLFQQICDIATTQGGFKMAWIGMIEGANVSPKFISGHDSGYFKEMKMRIDDSEWAQGPVGTAAKTLDIASVNSVTKNPDFKPWRDAAIERGFGSLAAVPLFLNKHLTAIFTLYSAQEEVFDENMLALLENLSQDISAAIDNLEQAQQKKQADAMVRKLSSAIEQSANAILIADTSATINYVNKGFTDLTGYEHDEIIGKNALDVLRMNTDDDNYRQLWSQISQAKSWHGEMKSRKKNGDAYWSVQSVSPIKNELGEVTHVVSTATDNTELHHAQEMIEQLAFYDPLTKLANRRLLMDRLEHDLASAKRHNDLLAVVLCDLDNFKLVNDSLGHDYGDQLLLKVASIFKKHVREEDTAARLGGDEFVLLISSDKNEQHITEAVSAILKELAEPLLISDSQVSTSSSIGIAIYPQDGTESSELLRNADLAMYHAKNTGKNRFQFFQKEMNESVQGRLLLETQIRQAVESESFELYYQPQVCLQTQKIIGIETLIRWTDNEGRFIPPDRFIPIAEESNLIERIGDWVIQKAFKDWKTLIALGLTDVSLSVNVAAYQFQHAQHLHDVINDAILAHPTCPANKFTVELTEGTLIDNIDETSRALATLKQLGISISIDDFGTGYSSLNYLKKFPVDQLKIDKSFIQDMLNGENDQGIVTAIIIIAEKLNMKLIAEGVETLEQAQFLLANGCGIAQGYYYHKPLPMAELQKLI